MSSPPSTVNGFEFIGSSVLLLLPPPARLREQQKEAADAADTFSCRYSSFKMLSTKGRYRREKVSLDGFAKLLLSDSFNSISSFPISEGQFWFGSCNQSHPTISCFLHVPEVRPFPFVSSCNNATIAQCESFVFARWPLSLASLP